MSLAKMTGSVLLWPRLGKHLERPCSAHAVASPSLARTLAKCSHPPQKRLALLAQRLSPLHTPNPPTLALH